MRLICKDRSARPGVAGRRRGDVCYTSWVPSRRAAVRAALAVPAMLALAVLPACTAGDPAAAAPATATDPPAAVTLPVTTPVPTPVPTPIALRVGVRPFREPNDYAHRNYCGAGATEVLLSAWTSPVPDVEAVARAIHLDPNTGATGADTTRGINAMLRPLIGADRYRGEHVTTLDGVLTRLRSSLSSADDLRRYGHTTPVMLQTMTKTMPGWRGWQATHMITIASASLDSGNPDVDTVTYAETPSTVAGYTGPDFQTISVRALWTAMQAFLTDNPSDPINVIW
jgi:hypothetical protein